MKLCDKIKDSLLSIAIKGVKKNSVKKYLLHVVFKDTATSNIYEFEDMQSATGIMNQLKDKVSEAWINEAYDSTTTRTIMKEKKASL